MYRAGVPTGAVEPPLVSLVATVRRRPITSLLYVLIEVMGVSFPDRSFPAMLVRVTSETKPLYEVSVTAPSALMTRRTL